MKKIALIITLLISGQLFCQEPHPELFGQWYLHELTMGDTVYLPTEYEMYPDILITEDEGYRSISFADPSNILCSSDLIFSETTPEDTFAVFGPSICFPETLCGGDPTSPCEIMYGSHANFYYDTTESPANYEIITNTDNTLQLTITNNNADVAIYSSVAVLGINHFSKTTLTIYPNPATNSITIETQSASIKRVEIYSINGQLLNTTEETTIDVSNLRQGSYFLKIHSGNDFIYKQFLKK
ncbi:hypothetical protein SCB49_07167 [unidentified eubacterium SCB49]|nr:hypothetical protein SCB49_07167 [unidentified eubacterium SCB49]